MPMKCMELTIDVKCKPFYMNYYRKINIDPEPTMYVIVLIVQFKKNVDCMMAHAFVIYCSGIVGFFQNYLYPFLLGKYVSFLENWEI